MSDPFTYEKERNFYIPRWLAKLLLPRVEADLARRSELTGTATAPVLEISMLFGLITIEINAKMIDTKRAALKQNREGKR